MQERDNFIALGKITSPHGIKGAVNIYPYGDDAAFAHYSHLFVEKPDRGMVRYEIVSSRPGTRGRFIVQLEGVNNRNMSEELAGCEVFIDSASLPEPGPDEKYWTDLIGLDVLLPDGGKVGRIDNILETAGHDIYVVKTGTGAEVLVPAVKDIVTDIDIESGTCTINPPPGLLEANAHVAPAMRHSTSRHERQR